MDLCQVEHVAGTAQFQHDIVGNVDQGRQRTLAAALEALLHPVRRGGTGVQAADDAARETAAQVRRADFDGQDFIAGNRHGAELRHVQRHAREGRHFACHAQHGQAVRLVRRQLDGEFQVVQSKVIAEILADRRVVRQFHQAGVFFRQFQFARGAQHALRLDAAQLAHLDFKRFAIGARRQHGARHRADDFQARAHVRRAADDVEHGARADIDLAHIQAVRIRMFFHLQDQAHHHVRERRGDRIDVLDFETGHGQQMGQFVRSHLRIDHGTEPVFGKLHNQAFKGSKLTARAHRRSSAMNQTEQRFS